MRVCVCACGGVGGGVLVCVTSDTAMGVFWFGSLSLS